MGPKIEITSTKAKLENYSGSKIPLLGKVKVICKIKEKNEIIEFFIVNCKNKCPVIGLPTIKKLKLITRVEAIKDIKQTDKITELNFQKLVKENNDVFQGIGKLNYKYDFKLKPGYVGKIEPCKNVPFKLMDTYKQELDSLVNKEILAVEKDPTEFVNSVVLLRKPNKKLTICLDPLILNENLLREHFKLPTFEELASKIGEAKIFAKLDALKAFWQVELTERSSKLTTFQTPFSIFISNIFIISHLLSPSSFQTRKNYRFLRLPYGVKTAPEIFHRLYTEIFDGIKNAAVYIDDILIWAKNEKELYKIINEIFKKAREAGVKFNIEKCSFGVTNVKFLGYVFTPSGIKMDDSRVEAIKNMKITKNKNEVESLLGVFTYIAKFIPNMSDVTVPLRELIKKGTEFKWLEHHQHALEKFKDLVSQNPVLQYYNSELDCVLSVDASSTGISAVLLQNNLPVAHASKALTKSQKAWAQIEKEMYAIVVGVERFHQYILGKPTLVESDHKPLIPILKKPITEIPMRLQKMRLRLQPYVLNVIHIPGKEIVIADMLSRAHLDFAKDDDDLDAHKLNIVLSENMSDSRKAEFIAESAKDAEIQLICKLLRSGWPKKFKDVPNEVKAYHTFHQNLSEFEGLLYNNNSLIVPKILRKEMLTKLHYNHMGIDKIKQRA